MKKSLLALAVLGAFAGVASAQSSVTLYGTVDLNGTYVKTDGQDASLYAGHGRHQQQPARLPRRRGSRRRPARRASTCSPPASTPTPARDRTRKFSNRRSTVSLFSNVGELRLGRDYTPTFWNQTIFDAFGTNGLGSSLNVRQLATAAPVRTTRSAISCRRTWAASTARSWRPLGRRHLGATVRHATSAAVSASPPVRSTSPAAYGEAKYRAPASRSQPGRRHRPSSFRRAPRRRPGTSAARGTSAS